MRVREEALGEGGWGGRVGVAFCAGRAGKSKETANQHVFACVRMVVQVRSIDPCSNLRVPLCSLCSPHECSTLCSLFVSVRCSVFGIIVFEFIPATECSKGS